MASRPKEIPKAWEAPGDTFSAWSFIFTEELTDEIRPGPCIGSYGINVLLSYTGSARASAWELGTDVKAVKGMGQIPFCLDCVTYEAYLGPPLPYEDCPPAAPGGNWVCINRHEGGIKCLFADWSVRKVGLKELHTLKWYEGDNAANPWTKQGGVKPEDWPEWMRHFKDY